MLKPNNPNGIVPKWNTIFTFLLLHCSHYGTPMHHQGQEKFVPKMAVPASKTALAPPKLRILVALLADPYMATHDALHSVLAELLAADEANVEYVHLLCLTSSIGAIEPSQRRTIGHNGRFVKEYRLLSSGPKLPFPNPWTQRVNFNPVKEPFVRFSGFFNDDPLLEELNVLRFNLGIVEPVNIAALELFQAIPSIRFRVATLSFVPYLYFLELFGHTKLKHFMPDVNNWAIGDHQIVGKNAHNLRELAQEKTEQQSHDGGESEIEEKKKKQKTIFKYFIKRQAEIRQKNCQILADSANEEKLSWEFYMPLILTTREKHRNHFSVATTSDHHQQGSTENGDQQQMVPPISHLLQSVEHIFVQSQPEFLHPLMEKAIFSSGSPTDKKNAKLQKKLKFFGGILQPKESKLDKNRVQRVMTRRLSYHTTQKIFAHFDSRAPNYKLNATHQITAGILNGDRDILEGIKHVDENAGKKCSDGAGGGGPVATVLVSFGTAVKMGQMPVGTRQAFREAFMAFQEKRRHLQDEEEANDDLGPIQFIWKALDVAADDNGSGHGGGTHQQEYRCDGPNIFISDWVKQPAILAHPSTRLYISHCGINSVQEAVHYGVPLICFPFFGDQYHNAEAMAARGWARVLDVREADTGKLKIALVEAISKMLRNSRKNVSEVLKQKSNADVRREFLQTITALRSKL